MSSNSQDELKELKRKLEKRLSRAVEVQSEHHQDYRSRARDVRDLAGELAAKAEELLQMAEDIDTAAEGLKQAESAILQVEQDSKGDDELYEYFSDRVTGKIINVSDYWDENAEELGSRTGQFGEELKELAARMRKTSRLALQETLHIDAD